MLGDSANGGAALCCEGLDLYPENAEMHPVRRGLILGRSFRVWRLSCGVESTLSKSSHPIVPMRHRDCWDPYGSGTSRRRMRGGDVGNYGDVGGVSYHTSVANGGANSVPLDYRSIGTGFRLIFGLGH